MGGPPFADYDTIVTAGGRAIPVRVTSSALHAIWGAGVGPQTPQAIFGDNRQLFEEIIADKLVVGDIRDDGIVVISDADLDM